MGKELGANVKRLRKQLSWSQAKLGEKSGIHRNHIGAIEKGTGNPTINVVAKLATLFGTKPANLLVPFVRKRTRPSSPAKPKTE
ncbi:MAG: helix-turn-helix transcriptional regulator [Lentilitoribacter sp.]